MPPKPAYPQADAVGGTRILFDRKGDLWGDTWTDGVFEIDPHSVSARKTTTSQQGAVHAFKAQNGLTSDQTHALFEDREGDIWIGAELGLDMLRPAAVVVDGTIPPNSPHGYRMAAADDGTVYIADSDRLYRIDPGGRPKGVLPIHWPPGSLCAASPHAVWLTLRETMLHVGDDGARTYPKPPEANTYGCAEDREGRLWMAALEKGLYWRQRGVWRSWPGLGPMVGLPANAAVDAKGRAVVLFRSDPHLKGGAAVRGPVQGAVQDRRP